MSKYGTKYTESEVFLGVLNDDAAYVEEMVGSMLAGELQRLRATALALSREVLSELQARKIRAETDDVKSARTIALQDACLAVCKFCRDGVPLERGGHWVERGGERFHLRCDAAPIREMEQGR